MSIKGHCGHDRDVLRYLTDAFDGGADFFQISHGLDPDQVDASIDQGSSLLGEGGSGFLETHLAVGQQHLASGPMFPATNIVRPAALLCSSLRGS
jgi:hypothetical protein